MDPLFDFVGQTVLVTGGSRGLGREMCLAFAARGANLVIASRHLDACEIVAQEVADLGGNALPYACHMGHWGEIETFLDAAWSHFGRIDVVVNNAGMSPLYPSLEEVSEELFDKVVGLNLKGPFRLGALSAARMREAGGGSIINISSINSVTPSPDAEPYAAAKAGLNALTRSFAHAYGPAVRVNAILAGPFLTDISKAWDLEAFHHQANRNMALGRGGEPHEVVAAALYLAGRGASFTTGALLRVDGGCR